MYFTWLAMCGNREKILICNGSSEAPQTHQIYEQAEENHAFFIGIVEKLMMAVLAVVALIPPLFPLSYSMFGYPPPQRLALPLQIQWAKLPLCMNYSHMRRSIIYFVLSFSVHCLAEPHILDLSSIGFSKRFPIWRALQRLVCPLRLIFGIFRYIIGMVEDMRHRLTSTEALHRLEFMGQAKAWSIYAQEIEFHAEIIRHA